MARYEIKHLNYITSGENRTFLNMDVQLDSLSVFDYVHLLANETGLWKDNPLCADIVLEQRPGGFVNTRYIEAEDTKETLYDKNHPEATGRRPSRQYDFDKSISVFLSALAHDGFDGSKVSVVLNEQQQYYHETDTSSWIYTRLYLSCCSDEYKQQLVDFFNSNQKNEHTYVIEHNQVDSDKNAVSRIGATGRTESLYDIDDVCMKSMNRASNGIIPSFDASKPGRTEDFYVPSAVGVVGFCQLNNDTYVLTDATQRSPAYVRVQLSASENIEAATSHYYVQAEEGNLSTCLYVPLSDLSGVSSYAEAVASGYLDAAGFYGSNRNFGGVEYNYIADVPMKKLADREGRTDYDNGNIYCDIAHAKNMYDSQYSMNMPSADDLVSCRNYTEIGKCGGQVYLKFDDNVSYSQSSAGKTVGERYSYPKIEFMNKIVTKTTNRHKSYFFSVNVKDVSLEYDEAEAESQKKNFDTFKKYIKHDLKTAIVEIAKNVCPAQTQLFDVYFDDQA